MRNSIVHNLKQQQLSQAQASDLSGTQGSDSKKFRRISDKSGDNQRFFKNLVDIPNSNVTPQVKSNMNNLENSKSDIGSRGTTSAAGPNQFNATVSSSQGVNSIQMANAYCQEGS